MTGLTNPNSFAPIAAEGRADEAVRDRIHIVCAADANYGPYVGIMLTSVLASNEKAAIHIHLFSDRIDKPDVERITAMARHARAHLDIYNIGEEFDRIPNIPQKFNHLTRTSYCRLFMPEFLPSSVQRVIYLDCDVVCVASLRELWSVGEELELVGGVRDPWIDGDGEHKAALGIPRDAAYCNAGVLLINVDAWRRGRISERLSELIARGNTMHADQDVLNCVLWQQLHELPRRWNVLITSPSPGEVESLLETAANIHFCGGFKPWHFGYGLLGGSGATAFRRAKAASPWRWMPPDFHLGRLKRKARQAVLGH